ncbi:MAG: YcnI family protein [Salinibacterium sp.]|nr:YcnI family protein [Salinibacterium sp.]
MNRFAKTAVALAAGTALALAAPLAASAHVSLENNTAEAGSFAILTFKVPNESATEGTTKVEVSLPTDTPFAYVSYVPVPGWTTEVTVEPLDTPIEGEDGTITEATTKVTWTAAAGSEITDGQLQFFPLSVGPIPDTGSIVLPVAQTYSDGTVVNWSETGDGAEHPAPVLFVNDAPAADHHAGADDAAVGVSDEHASSASSADVLARVLGIGGLVLGVVALVIAVAGRRKSAE